MICSNALSKQSVTVETPGASPSTSNAANVTIANPPVPMLKSMSPNAVAVATQAGVLGSGSGITLYDSGVARAGMRASGEAHMSFDSPASPSPITPLCDCGCYASPAGKCSEMNRSAESKG